MRRNFTRAAKLAASGLLWYAAGFATPVYGQVVEMGSLVTTYTQDFNTLPRTGTQAELGTNAFIPDGWTVHRTPTSNVIFVNNGSSNTEAMPLQSTPHILT